MIEPQKDDFNETLRRMMEAPPKEHKDMKKRRAPKHTPPVSSEKEKNKEQ